MKQTTKKRRRNQETAKKKDTPNAALRKIMRENTTQVHDTTRRDTTRVKKKMNGGESACAGFCIFCMFAPLPLGLLNDYKVSNEGVTDFGPLISCPKNGPKECGEVSTPSCFEVFNPQFCGTSPERSLVTSPDSNAEFFVLVLEGNKQKC